jgi:hypothetical protein
MGIPVYNMFSTAFLPEHKNVFSGLNVPHGWRFFTRQSEK